MTDVSMRKHITRRDATATPKTRVKCKDDDEHDEVKSSRSVRLFRNWLQIANVVFLLRVDCTDFFKLENNGNNFFSDFISFAFFFHFPKKKQKDKLRFWRRRMGRAVRRMRHERGSCCIRINICAWIVHCIWIVCMCGCATTSNLFHWKRHKYEMDARMRKKWNKNAISFALRMWWAGVRANAFHTRSAKAWRQRRPATVQEQLPKTF